jgi:hypothetical protein
MATFCPHCGTQVLQAAPFCPGCGSSTTSVSAAKGLGAAAQPAREETILLDEGGIKVTNARFITQGQTYAMSGVTSVKSSAFQPSRLGPILLILFGGFGALASLSGRSVGVAVAMLILAALGVVWFRSKKPVYAVMLTSASGESKAFSSNDARFVARIVSSINDAMVHRG